MESVGLPRGWYAGVAVTAALVLVAVLLLLPPPHRTRSAAPPGLPTLQSVWPAARPFPIPAVLDDGSRYHPKRILDPATSLGTADSADGRQVSLVLVSGGRSRVLQSEPVDRAGLFQGLLGAGDRLFWMLTATDAAGRPTVGLWSAARSGAAPALLTADVGLPLMLGSSYDLQLVAARLYWVATPAAADRTELRSVAVAGGPVSVETIAGRWAISAWPWLVSAPSTTGAPVRLYNVATRATVAVRAPAHEPLACSPVWCRILPADSVSGALRLVRPDGSDLHPVGPAGALPVGADVAVGDRFTAMQVPPNGSGLGARLVLHDIPARRDVLVAPVATNAYANASYLWWSTGDNETLAWYGLELHTLK